LRVVGVAFPESLDGSIAMAEPRDYTDAPTSRDLREMLTPVASAAIGVLLFVIYGIVS
jgi:hypothetical protein